MMSAVFRADASPVIGGGHVMRCLALADRLRDENWNTSFACSPETPETVPRLADSGHTIIEVPADGVHPLSNQWPDGTDWLIVDHYGLDAEFESRCRPWAKKTLVIDDLADRPHDCDMLLDPTFARPAAVYDGKTPDHCRVLTGAAYAPLRPQFAKARGKRLARTADQIERIFVSLGLAYSGATTQRVLEGLEASGLGVAVDLVVGSQDPNLTALRDQAEESRLDTTVHTDVDDMAGLMAASDLAIGAAGTSSWERCTLGLPALIAVTADNQRTTARNLADAGAAMVIGNGAAITPDSVARALKEVTQHPQHLLNMSRRAMTVSDGLGAGRVAMEMAPEPAHGGTAVRLRPATLADSDLIFSWQTDPATRRFSHTPEAPPREEHQDWMAAAVQNPGRYLNLILHDDAPVGVLRLDMETEAGTNAPCYVVSIFVYREHTGLGIGAAALRTARRLIPWARFVAEVNDGNVASHALFQAAGYHSEEGRYVCPPQRCQ